MAGYEEAYKVWAPLVLSSIAVIVSYLSYRTSQETAAEDLAPRLSITDVRLVEGDQDYGRTAYLNHYAVLYYKLQNIGRSTIHKLRIVETVSTRSYIHQVTTTKTAESFDPGDPVENSIRLVPGTEVPDYFTVNDVIDGKLLFIVQFETTSDTVGVDQYRSCWSYIFNSRTKQFDREINCTPFKADQQQ